MVQDFLTNTWKYVWNTFGHVINKRQLEEIMNIFFSGNGSIPPHILTVLNNEHLVKDNIALDFLIEVFSTIKQEKGISSVITSLKKGQLEGQLMDFFPLSKRNEEYFKNVFVENDLADVVKLHKAQASQEAKRAIQQVRNLCQ